MKQSFINFSESLDYIHLDKVDHQDVININGYKLDNRLKSNYFFIQHFRLARLEKYNLSILKLLQLAYNIGQLKAVFEKKIVNIDMIKTFYYANKLDDISTYISCDIHNKMLE